MKDNFLPLADSLLFRIFRISRDLRTIVDNDILDPNGIDLRDWCVLLAVGEFGRASQRQVVEYTCLDKVAVNRAARRLIAAGLIAMHADHEDGRLRPMRLTEKGQVVRSGTSAAIAVVEQEVLQGLADGDTDQLSLMFLRLGGAIWQRRQKRRGSPQKDPVPAMSQQEQDSRAAELLDT